MIGVRVTAAERELLEKAAEADGLPLATMLRRDALRAANEMSLPELLAAQTRDLEHWMERRIEVVLEAINRRDHNGERARAGETKRGGDGTPEG